MKLLTIIFFLSFQIAHAQQFTEIWCSKKVFDVPESVLYDSKTNKLYVSNIAGKPSEKNGLGYISLVDQNGKILEKKWVTGLNAPKGMAIRNGKLFVTDIDRVAVIDIDQNKIEKFIDIPGAQFLNDIVLDSIGHLYISDTPAGVVYRFSGGRTEKWLNDENLIKIPNGMAFEKGRVLIGTGNGIVAADPNSGTANLLIPHQGGIDGLIPLGNGQYIVSDWLGKTQILSKTANPIVLRNTISEKINAADLGFIPITKTVLIPTFFNRRVCAFNLLTK